jgi:hypothetical protein
MAAIVSPTSDIVANRARRARPRACAGSRKELALPYKILVLDNWHFSDDDYDFDYEIGPLPTAEAAIALAGRRLDADLLRFFTPGETAKELYSSWSSFGELPVVKPVGDEPRLAWSGLDYARERSAAIATSRWIGLRLRLARALRRPIATSRLWWRQAG